MQAMKRSQGDELDKTHDYRGRRKRVWKKKRRRRRSRRREQNQQNETELTQPSL